MLRPKKLFCNVGVKKCRAKKQIERQKKQIERESPMVAHITQIKAPWWLTLSNWKGNFWKSKKLTQTVLTRVPDNCSDPGPGFRSGIESTVREVGYPTAWSRISRWHYSKTVNQGFSRKLGTIWIFPKKLLEMSSIFEKSQICVTLT